MFEDSNRHVLLSRVDFISFPVFLFIYGDSLSLFLFHFYHKDFFDFFSLSVRFLSSLHSNFYICSPFDALLFLFRFSTIFIYLLFVFILYFCFFYRFYILFFTIVTFLFFSYFLSSSSLFYFEIISNYLHLGHFFRSFCSFSCRYFYLLSVCLLFRHLFIFYYIYAYIHI